MFARVNQYKVKPGLKDAANDDGSGYVSLVVESEATSNANASKVAALWGAFSDHMEEAPKAVGYDVVANWRN